MGDWLSGVSIEVAGGVIAAAIIALAVVTRNRWMGWLTDNRAAYSAASRNLAADELDVLRAQVIEVAKAKGMRVPVRSASRYGAVGVEFADGTTTWYFRSLEARKRVAETNPAVAMNSTHLAPPPHPVAGWSEQQCRDWLTEHAD